MELVGYEDIEARIHEALASLVVHRITEVGSIVLKPVLDKLATELENMDDSKIEKLSKALERGLKRIK